MIAELAIEIEVASITIHGSILMGNDVVCVGWYYIPGVVGLVLDRPLPALFVNGYFFSEDELIELIIGGFNETEATTISYRDSVEPLPFSFRVIDSDAYRCIKAHHSI